MNIDSPTAFIKNMAIIVGVVAALWYGLHTLFVTQELFLVYQIEEIKEKIDPIEKRRWAYQHIIDEGVRPLNSDELRRMKIDADVLDRHYASLERKQEFLDTLRNSR